MKHLAVIQVTGQFFIPTIAATYITRKPKNFLDTSMIITESTFTFLCGTHCYMEISELLPSSSACVDGVLVGNIS